MKQLFLLCAWAAMATGGLAQNPNAPGQIKKAAPVATVDLTATRNTVEQAKTVAKTGNATATEQTLTALNKAKPNTDSWYMETAQRLIQTAEQLAREGKVASVPALANQALRNLELAESKGRSAGARAAARTLAGFIQERYLADKTAALANYQSAAAIDPANATKAKEAADRLKRDDDNMKAKIARGGK